MARPQPTFPERLAAGYGRLSVRGTVLLAVSGGADSTALLVGTHAIAEALGLRPIVAHFDHGLRPASEEAEWVTRQATELGLEVVIERGDVLTAASANGRRIEETARRLRYEFLTRTAVKHEAAFVVTAHTADDLAETVLFHVLRGTGLRGLGGIPPRRRLAPGVTLVRPMLGVSRREAERHLASCGQEYLRDPSNADVAFTRNRLRHDLLPRLRETINPQVDDALRRLAGQATEAAAVLRRLAARELREALVEASPNAIRLRCRRLATRPRVIIREAVALAWRRAGWPRQRMGFAHWDAIAEVVLSGGRRTLPGGTDARRRRGELILSRPSG